MKRVHFSCSVFSWVKFTPGDLARVEAVMRMRSPLRVAKKTGSDAAAERKQIGARATARVSPLCTARPRLAVAYHVRSAGLQK
ncbi:hypothetical protein AAFF_G00099650 [Aldrovandia affinis]|uniref:Uncharacterized protein n=1 Tax=Aldrovandia affinis TaxID=143900 RepID=A0AAD7RV37_9TELE|nr:hypothetical protein AAFF_G00099650 [Aldrovandia affinis]